MVTWIREILYRVVMLVERDKRDLEISMLS